MSERLTNDPMALAVGVLKVLRGYNAFGAATMHDVEVNECPTAKVTLTSETMNKLWPAMCDILISELSAGRLALAAQEGGETDA